MKVAFFCKGSRGDVTPLAALAVSLKKKKGKDVDVVFVHDFRAPGDTLGMLRTNGIDVRSLPWPKELPPNVTHGSILHLSDKEKLTLLKCEMASSLEMARDCTGVVFNLFACEVWLIAQFLRIPCVAASSFVVSRAPVAGFERKLQREYPDLYRRLQACEEGEVCYAAVDHWMWRLFLDDLGRAAEWCGIPALPFLQDDGSVPDRLPPATPLLYGVSACLLEKQPFWPDSIHITGHWVLPKETGAQGCVDESVHVPKLMTLLPPPTAGEKVLYVGFGSMEEVFAGQINWERLVTVLYKVCQTCKVRVLLQSRNVPSSLLAPEEEGQPPNNPIHCIREVVPHWWLFTRCTAILCHGGVGTITAALQAGKPVIACPFGFDQQFWADRLEWLGVGCASVHPDRLDEKHLQRAIEKVHTEDVQRTARSFAQRMAKEYGIESAMNIISKTLGIM